MTKPRDVPVTLTRLTRKQRAELERLSAEWAEKLKPLRDANRAASRITAEDLATYIGPIPEN